MILVLLAGHLSALTPTGRHFFYQNKNPEIVTFFVKSLLWAIKLQVWGLLMASEPGNRKPRVSCKVSLGDISYADF